MATDRLCSSNSYCALAGALLHFASLRLRSIWNSYMRIPLNKTLTARVFERVPTVDRQYHIYDFGVEHAAVGDDKPAIDSIAVGGSFHSARRAYSSWTSQCQEEAAPAVKTPSTKVAKPAPVKAQAPEPEFSDDDEVIDD